MPSLVSAKLKEGDEAYNQQRDVILNPKHLWPLALKVIFDGKPFLCQIREDLQKDPFAIGIKGWWNNQSKS